VVPAADGFTMHDLLRVYAGEVCAQESTSGERQEALHRLYSERLRVTRRLAARAYPDAVTTSDPQPRPVDAGDRHRARRALEKEATGLAAVAVAAARDGHPAGWHLVDVLRPYVLSGPVEDWVEPVALAPAAARSAGDRRGEAAARFTSGLVAVRRDQLAEAIEQLDRAAAIADAEDWQAQSGQRSPAAR